MTKNSTDCNTKLIQASKQEVALYIVPTPIGNMEDITIRALKILREVDVIACEDTRVTSSMLFSHGIKASMIVYNDFSKDKDRNRIFRDLSSGKSVALVSDAGTPLISDPGYKLIIEAYENGYKVVSLPGASSVTVALTLSGLPTNRFLFEGFLPVKSKAKKDALEKLKKLEATCIFFESARRLTDTLEKMLEVLGDRKAVVLRELTKRYEERRSGTVAQLVEFYHSSPTPKGEIIIVTEPYISSQQEITDEELEKKLQFYLTTMTTKEAATKLASEIPVKKSDLYDIALKIKGKK